MDDKLVFGYGGVAGNIPCVYKDKGWYEETIPEYNIRKVEEIELFEELNWKDEVKTEGKPYGHRVTGGLNQLCEISIDEIKRLRELNQERKIQRVKAEEEEREGARLSWAKSIIEEIKFRNTPILSEKEEKEWRVQYNNIVNEGGEGYVPHRATLEDRIKAKQILRGAVK